MTWNCYIRYYYIIIIIIGLMVGGFVNYYQVNPMQGDTKGVIIYKCGCQL